MSFAQSTAKNRDSLKTLLLHLTTVFILCWLFYGIFLFIFPPLLFFWIFLCLSLSVFHRLIQRRVLIHYFQDDILVQLWLNPLLLMSGWLLITLLAIFLADFCGRAEIWRQILQIPVVAFSRVTMVYFTTIVLSAIFLFLELSFIWLPKLQKIHFNQKSRQKSRFTLLVLLIFMVFILFYLGVHKKENIIYISATMTSRWGGSPMEAIVMFKKIPPTEKRLYMAAVYRIGRIYQLKLKNFVEAAKWFKMIVDNNDSPLRDDALYQYLHCLVQMEAEPEKLIGILQRFEKEFSFSSLLDEAAFLVADNLITRELWNEGAEIYRKLAQTTGWSYTLSIYQNQYIHQSASTQKLALSRLNELHGRIDISEKSNLPKP
jgi:hypothetical protein